MMRRARKVRIYVRNKQRYNPETKIRDFLYVDVDDFVGTTIADIKEDVRKQTKSSVRIDELFLNNLPLADDRSVAHYNLQHETILETTSNPFWVACLYIKVAEVKQEQEGRPDDEVVQKWTMKSIPKKYTLIGLLLNAKKEFVKQPPHFPTLDDFVGHLEQLKKKGATMHPEYTQKDMRAFEREYQQDFVGKYTDPLSAFLDHYALRLGYIEPEDIVPAYGNVGNQPIAGNAARYQQNVATPILKQQNNGRQKQVRMCDDCEISAAELYCTDCPGGIALCQPCSQLLHAGAKRRRHNLQDIRQAPKTQKPYVPRAFLAPFALTVAMYRSLTEGQLSLTEDEIKKKAQPLTDTDLMDKQNGRYVGGFDCMENMLIAKGLVKKEAARVPTYALTESGHVLGEKLYTFYVTFYSFLQQHHFPKINSNFVNQVLGNRKICLVIDEHERDKERLLAFAADKRIDAQVRFLPAGDYVWILTPPMLDTSQKYLGTDSINEMVLPFVVERKSWEDFENSVNSARFQRQVNNMLGSGLKNCYYLMEGSLSALKSNSSVHHQQQLKAQVGKLTTEYGFFVNYTSSWMKSAQWLLWFSQFIIKGCNRGLFKDDCIAYADYSSRVARRAGTTRPCLTFRDSEKLSHRWTSHLFIDHIFRDNQGERSVLDAVRQDLHVSNRSKHLLLIQDLEQYNKKRQSTLNKCCELVCNDIQNAQEIVSDKIGATIHNMVHYDIASFWQLAIQVLVGVYVVRTENDEDTARVWQKFLAGPQGPAPKLSPLKNVKVTPAPQKKSKQNQTIQNEHCHGIEDHVDTGKNLIVDEAGTLHYNKRSNIYSFPTAVPSNCDMINYFDSHQSSDIHVNADSHLIKSKPSGGIPLHNVKPFSGEGHCLGSKNDHDLRHSVGEKRTSMLHDRHDFNGGLIGGGNGNKIKNDDKVVKEGRLGNQQEEGDALQKILSTSKLGENPVRNEEELYRLAVAMSMEDQQAIPSLGFRERDGVPESQEDQLRLALEMSMNESFQANKPDLGDVYQSTENEDLEKAIEISKRETRFKTMDPVAAFANDKDKEIKWKVNFGDETEKPKPFLPSEIDIPEEEQLNIALELSKRNSNVNEIHDVQQEKSVATVRDTHSVDHETNRERTLTKSIKETDYDEQLKIAIELSKYKSAVNVAGLMPYGQKVSSVSRLSNDYHQVPETTKHQDFTNVTNVDEDEQVKIALELSKHRSAVNNATGLMPDERKDYNVPSAGDDNHQLQEITRGPVFTNGTNVEEDEQLKIAIELSKKSSRIVNELNVAKNDIASKGRGNIRLNQVSKQGNVIMNYGDMGEEEQLRLAIEQSKLESYSPRKRLRSGDAAHLEIAIKRGHVENYSPIKRLRSSNSDKLDPSPRKRFKSGDELHESDSLNKGLTKPDPSEVILIDSQSQDIDEEIERNNNEILKLDEAVGDDYEEEAHHPLPNAVYPTCLLRNENVSVIQSGKSSTDNRSSAFQFPHETQDRDLDLRTSPDYSIYEPEQAHGENVSKLPAVVQRKENVIDDKEKARSEFATDLLRDDYNALDKMEAMDKLALAVKGNLNGSDSLLNNKSLHEELATDSSNKTEGVDEMNVNDADVDDDDIDDSDDFVPPTPDKMSNSITQKTPAIFRSCSLNLSGRFSTQAPERNEEKKGNTYNSSNDGIQIPILSKSSNVFVSDTTGGKSSEKPPMKTFDLKANLFYDSDDDYDTGNNVGAIRDGTKKDTGGGNGDDDVDNDAEDNVDFCDSDLQDKKQNIGKVTISDFKSSVSHNSVSEDKETVIPNHAELSEVKIELADDHGCSKNDKNESDKVNDMNDDELEDDLHDIDYHPDSQELENDSISEGEDEESDDATEDEMKDDLEDRFYRFNSEALPLIKEPRSLRCKKLKQKTERLIGKRGDQKYRFENGIYSNKKIKTEPGTNSACSTNAEDSDELLARHKQTKLDQDGAIKPPCVNDEHIAKELQDKLNREVDESTEAAVSEAENSYSKEARTLEEMDEAYAKQLDLILNGEKADPHVENTLREKPREVIPDSSRENNHYLNKLKGGHSNSHQIVGKPESNIPDGSDDVEAELQRKEFEKIERWKKAILDDERLARQLQQLEEMQKHQQDEARSSSTSQQKSVNVEPGDTCFKKMVALHKASREKALSQLNEYRQLQMERFQTTRDPVTRNQAIPGISLHTVIQTDDSHSGARGERNGSSTRQSSDWPWQSSHHIDQSQGLVPTDVTDGFDFISQSQVPTSGHVTYRDNAIDKQPGPSHVTNRDYFATQSQTQVTGHVIEGDLFINQSQIPASGHVTNRDNFSTQSQVPSTGHVTDLNQSQVKNSNITCGNCGEKGHNRTYYLCKNYHTAEETARRETKLEKMRLKKEEKKKMEVETLNLLTNHQQVLEEMTEQIETEMKTIQRRLKLKTSELEKQVSNRVKKIENTKKKRR